MRFVMSNGYVNGFHCGLLINLWIDPLFRVQKRWAVRSSTARTVSKANTPPLLPSESNFYKIPRPFSGVFARRRTSLLRLCHETYFSAQ